MDNRKLVFYILMIIVFIVFYTYDQEIKTIEEYGVSAGFGNDIEKTVGGEIKYSVPYSIYNFQEGTKNTSFVKSGIANSIGETRDNRQVKSGKSQIVGLQKIIVISEEQARFGVNSLVNILFSNPKMNDRSLLVVCKGNSTDILNFKIKGYYSSADFIEGLIKRLNKNDFFSDEYSLLNAYVMLASEGRNLVFPYIELVNKELKISGMAIFKEDKMLYHLDLEESRIMNILRENRSMGISTLKLDKDKSINYSAQIKRRVSCERQSKKYFFNVKIDFLANIISYQDNKELDSAKKKELENLIKKDLEQKFSSFINKMQNEYKVDMLQLGFIAASKYGKDKGIDWNKEVNNSKININLKVTVKESGRGEY